MRNRNRLACLLMLAAVAGCNHNQNPFGSPQTAALQAQQQQQQQLALQAQKQNYATQLDATNRQLSAQVAQSRQQELILRKELALTKQELANSATRVRQMKVAADESSRRLDAIAASTRVRGAATINPNNSVEQSLKVVELPGFDVKPDNQLLRISVPSDTIFYPGTAQIQPAGVAVIDRVAAAIAQHYPANLVAVEGHTDTSTPTAASGVTSNHQLSSQQAANVLNQLTTRNRMPQQQFFSVGHGGNHPKMTNSTPLGAAANRRVELVIYPQKLR